MLQVTVICYTPCSQWSELEEDKNRRGLTTWVSLVVPSFLSCAGIFKHSSYNECPESHIILTVLLSQSNKRIKQGKVIGVKMLVYNIN